MVEEPEALSLVTILAVSALIAGSQISFPSLALPRLIAIAALHRRFSRYYWWYLRSRLLRCRKTHVTTRSPSAWILGGIRPRSFGRAD